MVSCALCSFFDMCVGYAELALPVKGGVSGHLAATVIESGENSMAQKESHYLTNHQPIALKLANKAGFWSQICI